MFSTYSAFTEDRRQDPRYSLRHPASLFIGGRTVPGRLIDISRAGARFRFPATLADTMPVHAATSHLDIGAGRIAVSIRWRTTHEMGLLFVGRRLDAGEIAALARRPVSSAGSRPP